MLNSQKFGLELYENLGKLFYALASGDGTVHTKEIDKMRSLITNNWLLRDDFDEENSFNTAFWIETTYDWCMEHDKSSEECLQEFKIFYKEHLELFTPKIKKSILAMARAIANAYAGKNKSELILLSRLEIMFRKH